MTPTLLRAPVVTPALLFGLAFDLILFGILTAQVYVYYISFPKDRKLLQVAVVWVYLAGVAQTGIAVLDLGISLLQSGGFEEVRTQSDHLGISITALTGAVAIVIQSLYAYRIYLISQKRWLSIMIACMSVGQLASSIFGAFCFSREVAISFFLSNPGIVGPNLSAPCKAGFTLIWGPINIACDLTITICMVTFLLRHRRRSSNHQTRSHITRILQIVVETGMATTILMTIYTALFMGWNLNSVGSAWFPLPGLMMSKVYSNSMLVLLNNRATIAKGRNTVESFEFVEVSARALDGDIELRTGGRKVSSQRRQ